MRERDREQGNFFLPCEYCSNVLTEECLDDCVKEFKFKHFKLTPGTGIKDLPEYPLEEVLSHGKPRFRLVVVSIYLAAITDYLQHEDEYEFRENAKGTKTNVPDLKFKSYFRSVDDGKDIHRTSSGRVPSNIEKQDVRLGKKGETALHSDRSEQENQGE